ncbi:MAG: hypothetical protein FWG83_03110 [Oscillospiraceae bacterium]|nr:hypothetical protein [Oscillospiraceae bacterium]
MRYRKLKRGISILLVLAFVVGIVSSGVLEKPTEAFGGNSISYQVFQRGVGWTSTIQEPNVAGNSGLSNSPLESLYITSTLSLEYRTHVQNDGWHSYVSNGNYSGLPNQGKHIEAVQIRLVNAPGWNVYYRVYMRNLGWGDWAMNGEASGTVGQNRPILAIQIFVSPKTQHVTQGIVANGTFTSEVQHAAYPGDTLSFNVNFSRQAQVRFINESTGIYYYWNVSAGPHSTSWTVPTAGIYRFAIVNQTNFPMVVIQTASWTHTRNVKTRLARIITDWNGIEGNATDAFNAATPALMEKFGIKLILALTTTNGNLSGYCPRTTIDEICRVGNNLCGQTCNGVHHKNGSRVLGIDPGFLEYVVRVVGYRMCYSSNGHGEIAGLANVNGRNSVISTLSSGQFFSQVIQHELSHNLGVQGHCDNVCTMNDDSREINTWCSSCSNQIFNNK